MGRLSVLLVSAFAIVVASQGAANVAGAGSRADLTFTRVNGERRSVWVANADGSAPREIAARASDGSLSSDGRWLAYSRLRYSPFGTSFAGRYVLNVATGEDRRLGEVFYEQWAPRGATLAISSKAGLFLIDPASGSRREIVRGRDIGAFGFSPDGGAIAYTRDNGRDAAAYRSDVYAVRLSDRVITRLTRDGHSRSPLWGPEWIVYARFRWGGGLGRFGKLWLMRRDGSGKRFFARGAEGLRNRFPVYGLVAVALSKDGRRLLACQAFEFGCPRVTFTVPGGQRFGFPELEPLERDRGASPEDLSSDGARVLIDVGSPHDDRNHLIYEIPFAGGELRLIARNAIDARWRH